jgi:hypothetical protein
MTARERKMDELVGTAVQLAYEYPDFTCEHVYEMYEASKNSPFGEKPLFDMDELGDMAAEARILYKKGLSYSDALIRLTE